MRVTVSGRHLEITPAIREHVEKGLRKVRDHFDTADRVMDANVVLTVEKHRQIADITLLMNGIRMHGKETGPDMYGSVDAVLEKLEKQIRKFRTRINNFEPRRIADHIVLEYDHKVLETDEATEQGAPHRIVQRETVSMKPMSVDEALMQLELIEDDFLVFMNADTEQMNVLYVHKNGTRGLIEPTS